MKETEDGPNGKGMDFEREVASLYRALGAEVVHNVSIAGNQIDVLVKEKTPSGTDIRNAVECKAFVRPVGVHTVRAFIALAELLKSRGLIDRATMISLKGFTIEARQAAKEFGVDLFEIDDLRKRVGNDQNLIIKAAEEIRIAEQAISNEPKKKKIFVVMPFDDSFNDIYVLGIRETAEKLGYVVERADEIEHIGSIIDLIQEKITNCDAIIADTTDSNPNVFYEIGYAHGIKRPVLFICKEGKPIPFDLQSINYIIYKNIVDLRIRLENRLKGIFQ